MRKALLWKQLGEGKVQCRLCSHYCIIADGGRGTCGVRENHGGELYTLVAEHVAALSADPVEKKPLFHFMPGTRTMSFATMGCNLSCSFCQNHSLSQPPRSGQAVQGRPATPEGLVQTARDTGCASMSYTYSEPTVFFELMSATAALAKSEGLKNIMVSNGFMSRECLDELSGLINAANIDLKSYSDDFYRDICGARLNPVLDNLKRIVDMGWWLEVTTLVIPGRNDSPDELGQVARFIAEELGLHVPWHVSRFHPDHTMLDAPPTPVRTLELAWKLGREAGLKYVYTGNVPGHDGESTFCPGCGEMVIRRIGFTIRGEVPTGGSCPACGEGIEGGW